MSLIARSVLRGARERTHRRYRVLVNGKGYFRVAGLAGGGGSIGSGDSYASAPGKQGLSVAAQRMAEPCYSATNTTL